jgi:hypothetical protein
MRSCAKGSGSIDSDKIASACVALGLPGGDDYVNELMMQYDLDGDGVISFAEFGACSRRREKSVRRAWGQLATYAHATTETAAGEPTCAEKGFFGRAWDNVTMHARAMSGAAAGTAVIATPTIATTSAMHSRERHCHSQHRGGEHQLACLDVRLTATETLAAVHALGIDSADAVDAARMVALLDIEDVGSVGFHDFKRYATLHRSS